MEPQKAGFVSIVGNANIGKSTLLNAVLKQNLVIVSSKAQTTRHRILAVLNIENSQIIFSDTPGLLQEKYALHSKMMEAVKSTLDDSDVILAMSSPDETEADRQRTLQFIKQSQVPCIMLINKIDAALPEQVLQSIQYWNGQHSFQSIIPISALKNKAIDSISKEIVKLLPQHPWYYAEDELTDRNTRFFITEIIRKYILQLYQKEIPYHCDVVIDNYIESESIDKIYAIIVCGKESHKAIIIGKGAEMLKKLGTNARKEIEQFVDKKCFLSLTVKVKENWRDDELYLKKLGY